MLKRSDFNDPFEPIYSFVSTTGQNVHVASTRLRSWCLTHAEELEVFAVPVELACSAEFIIKNAVSSTRCRQLLRTLPRDQKDWSL